MGYIIFLIMLLIPILISICITKSFKKLTRIILAIFLSMILGIMACVINFYGIYLIGTYTEVGKGLIAFPIVLIVHLLISLYIFVPIISIIINRYNLNKISKVKFIIYMIILLTIFILINILM